jgi:hypothetical protein
MTRRSVRSRGTFPRGELVLREASHVDVGLHQQRHTVALAHLDRVRVPLGAAAGEDRTDASLPEHLRSVRSREEAVAPGDGSGGVVTGISRTLERELGSTDAVLLTHAVGDQLVTSHQRDRVAVADAADRPGGDQVLLLLQFDRGPVPLRLGEVEHEVVVRLQQVATSDRNSPDSGVERVDVQRGQSRVGHHAALALVASERLSNTFVEVRCEDPVEQPGRVILFAFHQGLRYRIRDGEVGHDDAAEDGALVTAHHLLDDILGRTADGGATGIAVLDADRHVLRNGAEVELVPRRQVCHHPEQRVDVGQTDETAQVAFDADELVDCERIVAAEAVEPGGLHDRVFAVLQLLDEHT